MNDTNGLPNKIYLYIEIILLLILSLLPTQLNILKILLMLGLCVGSFLEMWKNKNKYKTNFFKYTIIFIVIFSMSLLKGFAGGYEVDFTIIQVYLFRPIILFFLVQLIDSKYKFLLFMHSVVFITFIVIIYNLIYMLGALHIIPQIIFWENGATIVSNDFLACRVSNQGTLMYLIPMSIMLNMDIQNINFSKLVKVILRLNIVLGFIVVLLSGRRTLQIITLISCVFVLIFIFKKFKINSRKLFGYVFKVFIICIVGLALLAALGKMIGLNSLLHSVYLTIFDAFSAGKYTGTIRETQSQILIREWLKKPVLGWGLNAYVPYYIRSGITKWSYEYVYIAFLFQTGIVGVTIMLTYLFCILKKIFRNYVINQDNEYGIFFIATFVGFICFLIAGYTNPLVTSIWAWLITLVCFNFSLEK